MLTAHPVLQIYVQQMILVSVRVYMEYKMGDIIGFVIIRRCMCASGLIWSASELCIGYLSHKSFIYRR